MVIKLHHMLSHPGQSETIRKVKNTYYWPTLRTDVAKFVNECQACQAVKPFKTIKPVVKHVQVPDQRFSSLQIDLVGPLPESEQMRYLLTILDTTTRWIEAIPLPEASSVNCCKGLVRGWIQRFDMPKKYCQTMGCSL